MDWWYIDASNEWVPGNNPTQTCATSACGATVSASSPAAISDSQQNAWTITSSGRVAKNNVADSLTANVIRIAFINNFVWQEVYFIYI